MKRRRMAKVCKIDRLSDLPDDILICNIFSHLSLTDVVRTSPLSSRWRSLWKETPHLDLSQEFFETLKLSAEIRSYNENFEENFEEEAKYINDIVDNILLLHSGHVERLSIFPCELEPEVFDAFREEQWVQHAALKQVKHLSLNFNYSSLGAFDMPPYLPPSLFAFHHLRDLKLSFFSFIEIPTAFDGFHYLQSCYLSESFDETNDRFKQFIGLCPLLHKLVLTSCLNVINLKIEAPNLKSLNIIDYQDMKSLTLDCPQLAELKICSCMAFQDLHAPMLNSLKKLSLESCPRISELTLLNMLGCFCNLEEVQIRRWRRRGEDHSEQERVKGEVATNLTFPSLKVWCMLKFQHQLRKQLCWNLFSTMLLH